MSTAAAASALIMSILQTSAATGSAICLLPDCHHSTCNIQKVYLMSLPPELPVERKQKHEDGNQVGNVRR